MALGTLTYNDIINGVKSYLKSNCKNISNFGGMDACFKNGFVTSGQIAGNATATTNYRVNITRAISQVSSGTVDTDMTNFLSSIGVSNVNATLTADVFFNFINDMISFISTKCAFTVSQYSSNRFLIYWTGNTTYANTYKINSSAQEKISQSGDIHQMLNAIFNIAKQNIRCIPVQYNITLT